MMNLAEILGKPFDFVRIDLYSINNKIYFGEFTHYPASGYDFPGAKLFDFKLGKYWKLK